MVIVERKAIICRGLPKSSGHGGRVYDWLDSEHESDKDDSMALEDQFDAELVEYNLCIERAKVIVARLEKERARGQESDSDLSLLVSSQFNSIEL